MKLLVPLSFFHGIPRSELWVLDTKSGNKACVYSEPSPPTHAVVGKGITGIVWFTPNLLVCCDFNSVFLINCKTWKREKCVFSEEFNDLHQLLVTNQQVFVVNTGLDAIEELSETLILTKRYHLTSKKEVAQRVRGEYEINGDYYTCPKQQPAFYLRKVPEKYHLNNVFYFDKKIIATSFKKKCLINIKTGDALSTVLPCHPHDGLIYQGFLWVTTIDGNLYKAPVADYFQFEKVVNLFEKAPHHGWCRGLYIHNGLLFVAITAIEENNKRTTWLQQPIEKTKTGIYSLDLATLLIVNWYDFSHHEGARIFSLINADGLMA